MGELILCNTKVAASSFYIEEASLNIYSLEELSYYIYNNAYLLDETFIGNSMCKWIAEELMDRRLAGEILNLLEDDARLNVIIGHILRSCGYLTRKEIKDCLDIISSFEGKSEAEARKLRADHMMRDGRLLDAVFYYEVILDKKLTMSDELKGNIYNNLGCALSGLFFFDKAAEYFEKAYRLNRNTESLEMLLYCYMFSNREDDFATMVRRYQVLPEDVIRIRKDFKEANSLREIADFNLKVDEKISACKDEVEREFILKEIIDDYKAAYRTLRTY